MAVVNGTAGNDSLTGTASADSISGFAGNDTLNGLGAVDTLNGGLGNDRYVVTAGDVLVDSGGIDTVETGIDWSLGADFENVTATGTGAVRMTGHNGNNFAVGNSGNNYFNMRAGDDTIQAGAGDDKIDMSSFGTASYGNDVVDGGAGFDMVNFANASPPTSAIVVDLAAGSIAGGGAGGVGSASVTSIERVITGEFNDRLSGSGAAERLEGQGGNDTLSGMGGNDTLIGGTGQDTFVFAAAPASGNVDLVTDFVSATDKLTFDNAIFTGLGSPGNFTAGDARFAAGAGFNSGRDASDRIVYNTTNGQLFYDADGSGTGAAVLVATLQGAPALTATDIAVSGQSQPGTIQGTAGNDSLSGTEGNDSINGLAGNDTIDGRGGNDTLNGGADNDSLVGGQGSDQLVGGDGNDTLNGVFMEDFFGPGEAAVDTMNGGLGDDLYVLDNPGDVLSDAGGMDTVVALDMDWTLGSGFENLTLRNDLGESSQTGIGNELDNFIAVSYAGSRLEGRGGNDTLVGTGGDGAGNTLLGGEGNDSLVGARWEDLLDGGAGDDTLIGHDFPDTLSGGTGSDSFIFNLRPRPDEFEDHSDLVTDFSSGIDRIRFDARVMPELGASGTLTAGDPRFHAAPGAAAGHDGDDRLIYDTSSGRLYFDPDGNGAETAGLIATLQSGAGAAPLAATDITIDNGGVVRTGTAGNDSLVGDSGNDSLSGLAGNDTLVGLGGFDTLDGGAGADRLDGGAHDDTYFVTAGDVIVEPTDGTGGVNDMVIADVSWTLGAGQDHLILLEGAASAVEGRGNSGRNHIEGNSGNNLLDGGGGAGDTILGGGGDDTLSGAGYNNFYGDAGNDLLIAASGDLNGGDGNDRIEGGSFAWGNAGNDTVISGAGNAEISGGAGADTFVVAQPPNADRSNWDRYVDFTTGEDELRFDGRVFTQLGASGDFVANDERFYAAPGASAAHDATDRLVYNTTTGELWYDPDGSGGQAPVLVATLRDWRSFAQPANLQATDIAVDNGAPPAGGQVITGTAGNDSLTGTNGNDTLDGLGGVDTMNGGLGNDRYVVTAGDVLVDSGGVDTVETGVDWSLGADFENVTATGTGAVRMTGHNGNNFAIGNSGNNYFNMRAGDDTIQAGAGDDKIDMSSFGTASYGNDVIDGGAGFDMVNFANASPPTSAIVVDLAAGTIVGGGAGGVGSASVTSIERVVTGEYNDRLSGSSAAERLEGQGGNDTLSGLGGNDTLIGGAGQDSFVFASAPASGNVDLVTDFVSATDKLAFENAVFTGLGSPGNFTAGDARFVAGAGFTSGRDASDRVVYNTTTGSLYYDADGSGAGAAVQVATLQGNPAIAATDITVI